MYFLSPCTAINFPGFNSLHLTSVWQIKNWKSTWTQKAWGEALKRVCLSTVQIHFQRSSMTSSHDLFISSVSKARIWSEPAVTKATYPLWARPVSIYTWKTSITTVYQYLVFWAYLYLQSWVCNHKLPRKQTLNNNDIQSLEVNKKITVNYTCNLHGLETDHNDRSWGKHVCVSLKFKSSGCPIFARDSTKK